MQIPFDHMDLPKFKLRATPAFKRIRSHSIPFELVNDGERPPNGIFYFKTLPGGSLDKTKAVQLL